MGKVREMDYVYIVSGDLHDGNRQSLLIEHQCGTNVVLGKVVLYWLVTSGNHTPGIQSYSHLANTWANCLHPPAFIQWLLYNCRWLAYGLFQLTHKSCDDHAVESSMQQWPKEDKS